MKKIFFVIMIFFWSFVFSMNTFSEDGPNVEFSFVEFFPEPSLKAGSYFEIVFRLKNTGDQPINPYAEVAVSGEVLRTVHDKQAKDPDGSIAEASFETKEEVVLNIVDKKYKLYNLWPGETSSKLWLYIGILPEGTYKMRLYISALDRVRGKSISSQTYEMGLFVKE